MKCSLIITTYKRPDFLKLVLESVMRQTRRPDQILIADDGSDQETLRCISPYKSALPIIHTWQPDSDFRAARSRNLSLSRVTNEYVVMIDGDCLIPTNFIESHLQLAQSGTIVSGGRKLCSRLETDLVLRGEKATDQIFKDFKFYRLPLGFLRSIGKTNWEKVRTCNLGGHLADLLLADGFDETFTGWGLEDSDLIWRLLERGVTIKSARFFACVAHLYHEEPDNKTGLLTKFLKERRGEHEARSQLITSILADL